MAVSFLYVPGRAGGERAGPEFGAQQPVAPGNDRLTRAACLPDAAEWGTFPGRPSFKRRRFYGMRLFRPKARPDDDGYFTVAASEAVTEGEMTVARAGGRRLILTRWQGEVCAFDSACPHAAADLSRGSLYRGKIECHEHGYCFDIRSGRILWPEDEHYRLRRYAAKEEEGMVKVKVS